MSLLVGSGLEQRLTLSFRASGGRGIVGEPRGTGESKGWPRAGLVIEFVARRPVRRAAHDVSVPARRPRRERPVLRPSLSVSMTFVCERRTVGLAGFGRRSSFPSGTRVVVPVPVRPDPCHTLRRVSGARFVWVGRILCSVQRRLTPACLFIRGPRAKLALAESWVSCAAYLQRRHSFVPSFPRSSSVCPAFFGHDTNRS